MTLNAISSRKGLTLIELLAVVVIVGILAAVAVSSYRSYLVRARLQDAKVALETIRAEEEQFRAEYGYYCGPTTLHFFGGVHPLQVGDYRVQFTKEPAAGDDTYTARATPEPVDGRQSLASSPKYGGWIQIDQDGTRNSEARPNVWP